MGYFEVYALTLDIFQPAHAVVQGDHVRVSTFQAVDIVGQCLCVLRFCPFIEHSRKVFRFQRFSLWLLCLHCSIRLYRLQC